jgi:hypothetical protein
MATTYDPIATTTLGSAAATITFSSISSAYTDLRLVITSTVSDAAGYIGLRFNSDSGTNYSYTQLKGNGSSAATNSTTSADTLYLGDYGGPSTTIPYLQTVDIFSYAGSTYKTALVTTSQDRNGSGEVIRQVGLWRSTSAINAILLRVYTGNLNAGTTATLYGILKA